jgi:hypothetical protein
MEAETLLAEVAEETTGNDSENLKDVEETEEKELTNGNNGIHQKGWFAIFFYQATITREV